MKRESSYNRQATLPRLFVRLRCAKKLCVIKQVLRSRNGIAKGVRIVVFDNHPDTLRLIFHLRRNEDVDLAPTRASSWELVLVSIVIMGALFGMFWPIF